MSFETRWTSGPWSKSYWIEQPGNRYKPMVAAGGVTVAITHPAPICQQDECEANAHLIAAAPELYEALESLVRCIDETRGSNANDALHAAETALAKARGEPHAD